MFQSTLRRRYVPVMSYACFCRGQSIVITLNVKMKVRFKPYFCFAFRESHAMGKNNVLVGSYHPCRQEIHAN